MAKLETKSIRNVNNGIMQGVDNLIGEASSSVKFALNFHFDKEIGRAVLRNGTALVGSQIVNEQEILGLHQFIISGAKYFLAVVNGASNSALYRLIDTTWTTESVSGVADVKHRFLTYLKTVMVLDGTNQTSSADGDTWVTTGGNLDIGNCPAGNLAIEWHDRVYVAGVSSYEDRLYYSSIPTAGAISWTSGNGHLDIEPYEGQGLITGLAKVPGYLLIFKERALKRWNGSSTFPDDLEILGSPSQEAIVNTGKTVMYFSAGYKDSVGFYETNGNETRKISRAIQEIVEGISSSYYSDVAGFSNGEYVQWSIGTITFDEIDYSNVVARYHISTHTWQVFNYPTQYKVFSPYISGTEVSPVLKITAGNDDGEIIELGTGTMDNITGSSNLGIEYVLQYFPLELGSRTKLKDISKVATYTKMGIDTGISVRIDEKGNFKPIGVVTDDFENEINCELRGHTFEVKFSGISKIGCEIIGLDLIYPEISESIKQ